MPQDCLSSPRPAPYWSSKRLMESMITLCVVNWFEFSNFTSQCCVDCAKPSIGWESADKWQFPLNALSEMFWSDCCDYTCPIWHTTPWAKIFTLVLLALTVIYIYKNVYHVNVDSDYSSVSLHHVVSKQATLAWAVFRSMMWCKEVVLETKNMNMSP